MADTAPRFPISDHCDGRLFFNPRGKFERSFLRLLRWKLAGSAAKWPETVAITPQSPPRLGPNDRVAATWVNHATFLLQTRDGALLTDPIWSERTGPAGLGPRRAHEPGIRFEDLPKIDAVLLSHDHYDHFDVPTLRRLAARDQPVAIAPLGHTELLRAAGFAPAKIIELDWWQSHALGSSSITLTPARHWCNRLTGAANGRLWGGFYLRSAGAAAWFAGDTAYDDHCFRDIRQKLGAPDLALIPIGAYEPRWFMAQAHCNPEEAVQIHREVGARQSVGMHWGSFQLTDEGRDEPPNALTAALREAALGPDTFRSIGPGESVVV